jgi:hypothetical protein
MRLPRRTAALALTFRVRRRARSSAGKCRSGRSSPISCAGRCGWWWNSTVSHEARLEQDAARDRWFAANGYRVLRFTNAALGNVDGVVAAIRAR